MALFDNKPFVVLFNIQDGWDGNFLFLFICIVSLKNAIACVYIHLDSFKLVSTNSSAYGLTTCLIKEQSRLYMGAYSIDSGKSSINGL